MPPIAGTTQLVDIALVIVGWALLFIAGVQYSGLIRTIKGHYPQFYESLGSPPVFFLAPLSFGSALSFLLYILLGSYKTDEVPKQIAGDFPLIRNFTYAGIACFSLGVVLGVAT